MSKKTKVITLINYKGGVGKTLLSINIASYLSNNNKVLFIDADKQANATALLFNKYFDENNILDIFEDKGFKTVKLYDNTGFDKADMKELYFIPGSLGLGDKRSLIENKKDAVNILKNQLADTIKDFDYVIIDAPPDIDIIVKNALAMSDYYIIPFKPAPQEYLGMTYLLDTLKTLRKEGIKAEFLGVIINMFISEHTQTTATYIRQLMEMFPKQDKIFDTVIPRSQEYENALMHGLPIDLDPKASKKYKDQFVSLTAEIIKKINQ